MVQTQYLKVNYFNNKSTNIEYYKPKLIKQSPFMYSIIQMHITIEESHASFK